MESFYNNDFNKDFNHNFLDKVVKEEEALNVTNAKHAAKATNTAHTNLEIMVPTVVLIGIVAIGLPIGMCFFL